MDPDANLKEQLEIAKAINRAWDDCNADGTLTASQQAWMSERAERLAELVLALDEWRCKGGFLPARWQR